MRSKCVSVYLENCSEIEERVTGVLPDAGGNSNCLCSEKFPVEEPDSKSICITNSDSFHISDTYERKLYNGISRYQASIMTLPEYLTDVNTGTIWAPEYGVTYFRITISFDQLKEVGACAYILY